MLVGSIKCSSVCKKAVFSLNDLYVATCHEGQSEIFIWLNRSKYSGVHHQKRLDEVSLNCLDSKIVLEFAHTRVVLFCTECC